MINSSSHETVKSAGRYKADMLNLDFHRENIMKPQSILFAVLLVAAFSILTGAAAVAAAEPEEPIGMVAAVRGEVQALHAERGNRDLKPKDPLFRGDVIKTGERGRIQLTFPDNTVISLGRNSEMLLEEYKFDAQAEQGAVVTEVREGVFRIVGGAITRIAPENFQTRTATATIGIRGSFFAGRISGTTLTVAFLGGKGITVTNDKGSVLITKPSFGTTVAGKDSGPQRPRLFSAAEVQNLGTGVDDTDSESDEQGAGIWLRDDSRQRVSMFALLDFIRGVSSLYTHEMPEADEYTPPFAPPPPAGGDGTTGGGGTPGSGSGTDVDYGQPNLIMATAHADAAQFDWGYWAYSILPENMPEVQELALTDAMYNQGYILAGVRTYDVDLAALSGNSVQHASYHGQAHCTEIMPNAVINSWVGSSNINVNFATRQFGGSLDFNPVATELADSTLQLRLLGNFADLSQGLQGTVSSVVRDNAAATPVNSTVIGDFFGKRADAVGGGFAAEMDDARQYIGTFGAVKQGSN